MHEVVLFPGDSFFTYILSLKKVVWLITLEEKIEEKGMERMKDLVSE